MTTFSPMLAAEAKLGDIKYPKIALPKLNGVRGVNQEGQMLARSLKQIPNNHVHNLFSWPKFSGLDGELVVGPFDDEEVFTKSTSGVMSKNGAPDIVWHIFDRFHPTEIYRDRLERLEDTLPEHPRVSLVQWKVVHTDDQVREYADWALSKGYEGLVLRDPFAKYKQGRSTAKEGGFMRFCPWLRSEAIITAVHEGCVNKNVSKTNELGYLRKSSHKSGIVSSGQAGAFSARDIVSGIEFNMPVPTDKLQKEVWANPSAWIGTMVRYHYKPAVKKGGKPRFPQFDGLRDVRDMS